jgi:hypothetical protein
MSDTKELPRWQSHKKVHADKVVGVQTRPLGKPLIADDTFIDWILECGALVHVSHELRRRGGDDPVGGYFVHYPDGFQSWSPAKAFEEGYDPIERG